MRGGALSLGRPGGKCYCSVKFRHPLPAAGFRGDTIYAAICLEGAHLTGGFAGDACDWCVHHGAEIVDRRGARRRLQGRSDAVSRCEQRPVGRWTSWRRYGRVCLSVGQAHLSGRLRLRYRSQDLRRFVHALRRSHRRRCHLRREVLWRHLLERQEAVSRRLHRPDRGVRRHLRPGHACVRRPLPIRDGRQGVRHIIVLGLPGPDGRDAGKLRWHKMRLRLHHRLSQVRRRLRVGQRCDRMRAGLRILSDGSERHRAMCRWKLRAGVQERLSHLRRQMREQQRRRQLRDQLM